MRAGDPELGVRGDDEPGPAVGRFGGADFRGGPAQDLLDQPEGVLAVEPARERLPEPVDVCG